MKWEGIPRGGSAGLPAAPGVAESPLAFSWMSPLELEGFPPCREPQMTNLPAELHPVLAAFKKKKP